jgi:cold-inducible RNA-binding protein
MATRVFVGNLSYHTTEEALQTLFADHGEVESVRIITDRYTGRSKGFAFVEMNDEGADAAIGALHGKSLDGRDIRVEKAQPRPEREQKPGWGRSRW